mgnify:CR=1 FL=1
MYSIVFHGSDEPRLPNSLSARTKGKAQFLQVRFGPAGKAHAVKSTRVTGGNKGLGFSVGDARSCKSVIKGPSGVHEKSTARESFPGWTVSASSGDGTVFRSRSAETPNGSLSTRRRARALQGSLGTARLSRQWCGADQVVFFPGFWCSHWNSSGCIEYLGI